MVKNIQNLSLMNMLEINLFDLLSGKAVQNRLGTFYFKEAGNNTIHINTSQHIMLYTDRYDTKFWFSTSGCHHNEHGPAVIYNNGMVEWWLDNEEYFTQSSYEIALKKYKPI